VGRPLDEAAVFEAGAGADERDELRCVDRAPAVLGGLDEFERLRCVG
jgi:integrase/recombinase XerD